MGLSKTIWATPVEYLARETPDNPVLFFSPAVLHATARRFLKGFPGLVTFAVKSNPDEMVIQNLDAAGIRGYDVASLDEIDLIRRVAPARPCITTTRFGRGSKSRRPCRRACGRSRSIRVPNWPS